MLGATDKTRSPITGLYFEVIFNENIKLPLKCQWNHRSLVEVWLYSFFNLGPRLGWVVKATLQPHPRVKTSLLIVEGDEWNLGPVWTDMVRRNTLSFEGVHSSDRPAHSELLLPLGYLVLVHEKRS